jgi:hypothetical protein
MNMRNSILSTRVVSLGDMTSPDGGDIDVPPPACPTQPRTARLFSRPSRFPTGRTVPLPRCGIITGSESVLSVKRAIRSTKYAHAHTHTPTQADTITKEEER